MFVFLFFDSFISRLQKGGGFLIGILSQLADQLPIEVILGFGESYTLGGDDLGSRGSVVLSANSIAFTSDVPM